MAGDSDEKCVKKMNKLIYPESTGEKRPDKYNCTTSRLVHRPSICRLKPKQVRICNRADMKKMVPPIICDCKVKTGGGLLSLLMFGLKAAFAAGAIYVTYDLGIWGTTDQTQEMYRTYCAAKTSPQIKKQEKWNPPSCEAERGFHKEGTFYPYSHCDVSPIDMQNNSVKWSNYWNSGVTLFFGGLAGLPYNLINILSGRNRHKESGERKKCEGPEFKFAESEVVENHYK